MIPKMDEVAAESLKHPLRMDAVENDRHSDHKIHVIHLRDIPHEALGRTSADVVFTCDADYPWGPAWHLAILPATWDPNTPIPVEKGGNYNPVRPTLKNAALFALVEMLFDDLGEGDPAIVRAQHNSTIHAMRLLRLDERLRMGQSGE